MLTGRQCHLELFDERGYIPIANYCTLPFLDAHDRLVDVELEVAFHFTLASKAPAFLYLLACEV